MEFQKLLRGFDCACGRRHTCPIRFVAVGPGAIDHLAELAAPHGAVLLVADENTYAAAGAQAERALAGKAVRRCIFPGAPLLVPDTMKDSKNLYTRCFSEYKLSDEDLKRLQNELLEILVDIKTVCDKQDRKSVV